MSIRPSLITPGNFHQYSSTSRGGSSSAEQNLAKLGVDQLRVFARSLQISTAGNKEELVSRIQQHLTIVSHQSMQVVQSVPQPSDDPCHKFAKKQVLPQETLQRRQLIHQAVKETLGGQTRVEQMTEQHLLYIFQLYDHLFFQNRITQFFNSTWSHVLRFEFGKGTSSGGCCKRKKNGEVWTHTISMSRPVLMKSCIDNTFELVNGLQARDQLECLLLIYEHELVHLMVHLWAHQEIQVNGRRQVHGSLFKTVTYNLFGHTDFHHEIGHKPQDPRVKEDYEAKVARVNAYLRPGMAIRAKDKDSIVSYVVVRTNPRSNAKTFVAISKEDKKTYRVPLSLVVLPEEEDGNSKETRL